MWYITSAVGGGGRPLRRDGILWGIRRCAESRTPARYIYSIYSIYGKETTSTSLAIRGFDKVGTGYLSFHSCVSRSMIIKRHILRRRRNRETCQVPNYQERFAWIIHVPSRGYSRESRQRPFSSLGSLTAIVGSRKHVVLITRCVEEDSRLLGIQFTSMLDFV